MVSNVRLPARERRLQLLNVARVVFAETGFHETAMNDIADAAGVTKPVLYQHYASKRELYRAVLEEVGERLQALVFEQAVAAGSPREKVEAGLRSYLDFVQEDFAGFSLIFSGASREDDEWAEIAGRTERSIADGIASLIAVDGMSEAHRLALAHGVVGLAEGMVRYWKTSQSDLEADDLLNDLITLAWAGLRGLEAP